MSEIVSMYECQVRSDSPSEGMKPDVRKWIYVATRRGWLHSLKVRLVEKMFATKFKELTTTRF
jgi:hypothetical protein